MYRLFVLCWLLLLPLAPRAGGAPPAPPLQATLLDGGRFSLAEHRGDVVIVNFWATWCEPCRAELAAFRQYLDAHAGDGLALLAVSMDDPEDAAKVAAATRELPLAVAMGDHTDAAGYGRIWRLPMTFIIDRAGRLRIDGGRGPAQVYDLPALRRDVDPLLAEPRQKP